MLDALCLVDRIFSESIQAVVDYIASQNSESVTLDFRSKVTEAVDDFIKVVRCQVKRYMSRFTGDAGKRLMLSKKRRSALFFLVLLQTVFDIGNLFDCVIEAKPASTDSGVKMFLISLRISCSTTSSDVRGGTNRFEISFTALVCQTMVNFPDLTTKDLGQTDNPRVRRSESCESIRSFDSFLSDPVVDWKYLLYGYNR